MSPPAATMRGRSGGRRGGQRTDAALIAEIRAAHAGLARHLRRAAHSCRACGQGHSRWAQAHCAADVAGRSCRRQPTQVRRHDGQGWRSSGAGPRRAQLRGGKAESAVGRRHHLHSDLGRLSLPGGRARCLQPSHRRLVDGHLTRHPAGARRLEHGALGTAAKRA